MRRSLPRPLPRPSHADRRCSRGDPRPACKSCDLGATRPRAGRIAGRLRHHPDDDIGRSRARRADRCARAAAPAAWHADIAADVAALTASFAAIMALSHVVIRLERVVGDACKRWHADYVPVRLISTYCGSGTQWIERSIDRAGGSPVERPRSLTPGAVGLFKGRILAGEQAIVHRSPPIAGTGEARLLLVIDSPPRRKPPRCGSRRCNVADIFAAHRRHAIGERRLALPMIQAIRIQTS
ncbi:DUF1826 domain-containing protein [Sphingomonas aurantiaca]|uniref:DUF1826 domain-containing protein n=1 Tax=Sphingomonas aurantiaca TaxID=185949 RepID=UPI002FDF229A